MNITGIAWAILIKHCVEQFVWLFKEKDTLEYSRNSKTGPNVLQHKHSIYMIFINLHSNIREAAKQLCCISKYRKLW